MRSRWLGPACILLMLVFGLAVLDRLPERVPIHWNLRGEVDATSSWLVAVLFIPVFAALMWALFVALLRWAERGRPAQDVAALDRAYWLCVNVILVFFTVVQLLVLGSALGWAVSVWRVVIAGVGLMVAVVGFALRGVPQNPVAGIRTPWTLADAEVWRETHRVGAPLLVAAGLIAAAGGLLLPPVAAFVVLMASLLGACAALVAYSYVLWRGRRRPGGAHG